MNGVKWSGGEKGTGSGELWRIGRMEQGELIYKMLMSNDLFDL